MAEALSPATLQSIGSPQALEDRMTLLVFNGDFDRLQAALMVALGGAAAGLTVTVFFSFWAVLALKQQRRYAGKGLLARLLTAIMPAGIPAMGTSRMNFCGAGPHIFGTIMKHQGVQGPAELLETAREMGVRFVVCPVSMEMMGIDIEELVPGIELGGVTSFVESASRSKVNLVF